MGRTRPEKLRSRDLNPFGFLGASPHVFDTSEFEGYAANQSSNARDSGFTARRQELWPLRPTARRLPGYQEQPGNKQDQEPWAR